MSGLDDCFADPTVCYAAGCEAENELMLHLADRPWGGGDFCLPHAMSLIANTPLVWTCPCPICARARAVAARHEHANGVVLCPSCQGTWHIRTASGTTYVLNLEAKTLRRVQSREAPPGDFDSISLRRDGEALPVLAFDPVRLGAIAKFTLGEVDDYAGYLSTRRWTTPVESVVKAG